MGCWNESCGVTGLPVAQWPDAKVRYMIIRKVKRSKHDHAVFYPFDIFQPVSVLVEGEYDDYGGVDLTDEAKAALFASLKDCDIEFTEVEMHGNFRVNGDEYSLPMDHYHWFIREDAFQMLHTLPMRDSYDNPKKTLGDAEKETIAKALEISEDITKSSALFGSLMSSYRLNDAFGRLEMPQPPIYPILKDRVLKGIVPMDRVQAEEILDQKLKAQEEGTEAPDLDAILAALPKPDLSTVEPNARPLLDLNRILYGMLLLRKQLHPTGGAGSQAWNDTAYEVYGEFVAKTARDYRKEIEE